MQITGLGKADVEEMRNRSEDFAGVIDSVRYVFIPQHFAPGMVIFQQKGLTKKMMLILYSITVWESLIIDSLATVKDVQCAENSSWYCG